MKITHLLAAGLMVAGLGVNTTASAQSYHGDRYSDHRGGDRHDRGDRRYDRGDRNHDRHDRRYARNRGYGWNRLHGQRCHAEWRHHRRVTICR